MNDVIQKAATQPISSNNEMQNQAKQSLNVAISALIDREGMKKRFEDLLGKKTPQFMSTLVSLINATPQLKEAFYHSPMTIIQSALKAATFDLPIDPNLGYAYIVPFKSQGVPSAQFIIGYKGMIQLALRTGAYKILNVTDIRAGELKKYNRLTEDIEIEWIEDEEERESAKTIGYVGYFKLINGAEKTIYMSVKQIETHERKHRKGSYQNKIWKDDFDAMASKTILRRLIGKWGLMSVDYQRADESTLEAATAIAEGRFDDEDVFTVDADEINTSEDQFKENTERLNNNEQSKI